MSSTAAESIAVSEMRGPVLWVWFNRPEVKNALTPNLADLVRDEIEKCHDRHARVVVLSGKGGAFCSGADLKAIAPRLDQQVDVSTILKRHYHPLVTTIARLPLPVIAAVDGAAAGIGSDIALACDLRLASDAAFFAEIFVNINLLPDGGGTYHLPRLVGLGRALEMAFTGCRVGAEQAQQWGLVNHVFPVTGFEDCVQKYAEQLAAKAPMSMARSKEAMRRFAGSATLEDALEHEAHTQQELIDSRDFREGVMAFLEKRPPKFAGK